MKIAVLITCHNRKLKTLACLGALYKCEMPENYDLEVFLVDDGSTDGTGEAVHTNYSKVNIINGSGNLYWNRGMHLAWKTANETRDYDFYLWLNDDTLLFENALTNLLITSINTNYQSIIIAATCSVINNSYTYGGYSKKGDLVEPTGLINEIHTFNGNCVLIPKNVYMKVGLIDPLFHHAIGDIDYGLRANKLEIKSYLAPHFLAFCEGHEKQPNWCQKEIPFFKRVKSLYSPLGNSHPYYYFRFELRHYGLFTALKHLFSIHLRLIIPQLWMK
jgi:GT2 family glycosyltransferase